MFNVPLTVTAGTCAVSCTVIVLLFTVLASIVSLKVTMIWLVLGTSFWPGAGNVFRMTGEYWSGPTVKDDRKSYRPAFSLPPLKFRTSR